MKQNWELVDVVPPYVTKAPALALTSSPTGAPRGSTAGDGAQ